MILGVLVTFLVRNDLQALDGLDLQGRDHVLITTETDQH